MHADGMSLEFKHLCHYAYASCIAPFCLFPTDIEVEIRLTRKDGTKYYVKVSGCNSAGLCSNACSDGITIDTTPPIPPRVLDGYGGKREGCNGGDDLQYQASRFVS